MAKQRKSRKARPSRRALRSSNPRKRRKARRRNPVAMGYQTRASNPKSSRKRRKARRKRNTSSYAAAVRRGLARARHFKGRKGNPVDMGYQVRSSNPKKGRRRARRRSRSRNPGIMGVLTLGLGGLVGFSAASFLGGLLQRVIPATMAPYAKFLSSLGATVASALLLPKVIRGTGREFLAPVIVGMGIKTVADGLGAVLPSTTSPLIQKVVGIRSIGSAIPAAVTPGAVTPPAMSPEATAAAIAAAGGGAAGLLVPGAAPSSSTAWNPSAQEQQAIYDSIPLSGMTPAWSVGFPGYNNAQFPQLAENAPAMGGPPQMGYESGMNGYYNYQPELGGYYDYHPALSGNPFGEPF